MTENVAQGAPQARTHGTSEPGRIAQIVRRQEFTLVLVVLVIGIVAVILNPIFVSANNLIELARATVIYFIMACGATLITIGGGLDFSVGSVFTLGGISTAWGMSIGLPWPLAILIGLLSGTIAGLANALIIEKLGVPPIITTLGTFYIISGLIVVFSGGNDIVGLDPTFELLGQGALYGVPLVVVYAIVVGVVFWIVLEKTRFGYNVRAIGGNRGAAVANGISATSINRRLYAIGGVLAALAGIIYTARTGSGQVSAGGSSVTLVVTSAVLIGGTSLFGGLGTITGTVIGALLFAEIDNGLALSNISPLYLNIVIGSILILAVAADYVRRQRLYRR
ncbi:ABC transporter permease [Rugosimonospora africana]|uniref:Ribose ABC transporter permease n=1 Tax=Rugosimonospora africana TaxID=556532 RepID=A0A8J3R471_9ACTN|nr:ABC transporter permease [Rugosimonospora africana]GIH21383.1 ribose ABC transporter permease [Rugosimonospora africana]